MRPREMRWDLINQFGFTSFAYLIMANQLVRFFLFTFIVVCLFRCVCARVDFHRNFSITIIIEDLSTRAHQATPSLPKYHLKCQNAHDQHQTLPRFIELFNQKCSSDENKPIGKNSTSNDTAQSVQRLCKHVLGLGFG